MSAIVLPVAIGACARRDTGRGAVAAAARRVDRIAAIALAGAAVGLVVALGLSITPDVSQLTVFTAAFLAGFASGAGGRFGAADVILTQIVVLLVADWALSMQPMLLFVRWIAIQFPNILNNLEISHLPAITAFDPKRFPRLSIVRRRIRRHPRQQRQRQRQRQQNRK